MKKIPTLFERIYKNHEIVGITDKICNGMEWVIRGEGIATVKWDGACCAIINGELYKRYDAKKGRRPPEGAIPCCDPDSITGHHPHWVKCDKNNPSDKWFLAADENSGYTKSQITSYRTYEAIGTHFNGNPYNMNFDILRPHGTDVIVVERTFDGIKKYLSENDIEGIVFWLENTPMCKIKRTDFGMTWPIKTGGWSMTTDEALKKMQAVKSYMTSGNPIWSITEMGEAFDMAIEALEQPERKSAYLINPNPYGKCSNCGQLIDIRDEYNYCPNCGASMMEGEQP